MEKSIQLVAPQLHSVTMQSNLKLVPVFPLQGTTYHITYGLLLCDQTYLLYSFPKRVFLPDYN